MGINYGTTSVVWLLEKVIAGQSFSFVELNGKKGGSMMKRDMELIRKIMLNLEGDNNPEKWKPVNIDGYDSKIISYHLKILFQSGIVEAKDVGIWWAKSLTWEGHEFLDAIRNETVWNQIKEKTKHETTEIPFKVMVSLSIELAKIYFKDKFGL